MNRVIAFAVAFILSGPAAAQWQTPEFSVPTGKGPGKVGFGSAAPGTAANCFLSNGTGTAPSFQGCGPIFNNTTFTYPATGGQPRTWTNRAKDVLYLRDFISGVPVNGTDYSTQIQAAIDAAAAIAAADGNGSAVVEIGPGSFKACGVIIKSGVSLRGENRGTNWPSLGIAVGAVQPTLITPGSNCTVFTFTGNSGAITMNAEIRDLAIDCAIATPTNVSDRVGILIESGLDIFITNVSIRRCSTGTSQTPLSAIPAGTATSYVQYNGLRIFDCYVAMTFEGRQTPTVRGASNSIGYDIYIATPYLWGMNFAQRSDNNTFYGVRISIARNSSTAIVVNSADPANPVSVGNIVFIGSFIEMIAGAGTSSIIVNNTDGLPPDGGVGYNGFRWQGGIAGDPPVVQNGGIARITEWGRPVNTINYLEILAGSAAFSAPVAVGYGISSSSSLAVFTPSDYIGPSDQTGTWLRTALASIMWVTVWDPQTAVGGVQLRAGNGVTVIGAGQVPGAAGLVISEVDVTAYFVSNGASTNLQVLLYSKGDGATGPLIYKSYLKIKQKLNF